MKNLILNYWWLNLIVIGLLFIFGLIIKGFINASRNPMPENFENGDEIMTELRAKYKDYNDRALILGGGRSSGIYAGSRSVYWSSFSGYSWDVGCRFACDHMNLA